MGVVGVFAAELITTKPRSRQNQKMDDNLAVRMAAETMLDLSAACRRSVCAIFAVHLREAEPISRYPLRRKAYMEDLGILEGAFFFPSNVVPLRRCQSISLESLEFASAARASRR